MTGTVTTNDENGCELEYSAHRARREEVVPFNGASSPHRSLTRKPGGTTNCRRHPRWRAREGDSLSVRLPSAQPGKDDVMQVVHERCAGLDVHKKSVYACALYRWKRAVKRSRRFEVSER